MNFSPERLLQRLQRLPSPRRYVVAFSGGCDSAALLDAMSRLGDRLATAVCAIHVDHGLNPAAGEWSARCEAFCRQRGVDLQVHRLELRPARGASVEAVARDRRYRALEAAMERGDAVVTAHHRDDQAETFLLSLMRGAGPRGLAGMPAARRFGPGLLLRPLLDFSRSDLEAYARARAVTWIDDDSNRDTRFDRNYVREQVLPLLRRRWPAADALIARAAGYCGEADNAVRTLASADVAAAARGAVLAVAGLTDLPEPRRRAALREWLDCCGLPLPDHRRLGELLRQSGSGNADALPLVTWPGAEVRRWRGRLYAAGALPPTPAPGWLDWAAGRRLPLPAGLGALVVDGDVVPPSLRAGFRRGGESCRMRGLTRPLKKVLQELGIPPWLRSRLPLVFLRGDLVALGDLVFLDGWPASLRMKWQKGPGWPDYGGASPSPEPAFFVSRNDEAGCEPGEHPL